MSMLWVAVIALAVAGTASVLAAGEAQVSRSTTASEQTFQAAESGLNRALYQLAHDPSPASYSVSMSGITVAYDIQPVAPPGDPYDRTISVRAEDPTGKVRTLEVTAHTNSYAGSLSYAIQAGVGGIVFDNTSKVYGDVYSNGPVGPDGGGDAGEIRQLNATYPGNVTIAGLNGIVRSKVLDGSVRAYTIEAMDGTHGLIAKDAYYQTLIGSVKANNGVEICSTVSDGTYCHRNQGQQPTKPLLITDEPADPTSMVPRWVAEVTAGPNPPLDPSPPAKCPNKKENVYFLKLNRNIRGNYYCVHDDPVTLGRQVINGSLYVGNHQTLTLTGDLYVTGNVIIDNDATVRVQPNAASTASWSIISEGVATVENGATLQGSGNPSSFLMVIVRSTATDAGGEDPAIYASNNSTSVLFVAPNGMVKVKNLGHLRATVANVIKLGNNSDVTFNPNLTNLYVPPSGTPTVGVVSGSWRER